MTTSRVEIVRDNDVIDCDECGGRIRDNCHEAFCEDCGAVAADTALDIANPSGTPFDSEDRYTRPPRSTILLHDRGLGSEIGFEPGADASRRRRWHGHAHAPRKTDKNLRRGIGQLRRMADALEIPEPTLKRGVYLYRAFYRSRSQHGHRLEDVWTACLFAACREHGVVRTLEECIDVGRGAELESTRSEYRRVCDALGCHALPPSARAWVPRLASDLNVDPYLHREADAILERAERSNACQHRTPRYLAATAIWLAAESLTQHEVADLVGATQSTIRNCRDALVDAGAVEEAVNP